MIISRWKTNKSKNSFSQQYMIFSDTACYEQYNNCCSHNISNNYLFSLIIWHRIMYGEKRRRCVVDETENFASPRRAGPFIRNEFRVAAASATTTDPREVHPGAELTLVTTHHRHRPDSTRLSSETVLSSMAKRSMDRRKQ